MITHHYVICGLENIHLVNGYAEDGNGIAYEDIDGLHRAIGGWLSELPRALTGREIRFLRQEMQLSAGALGHLVGATAEDIRAYESSAAGIPDSSFDRLVRLLYLEGVAHEVAVVDFLLARAKSDGRVSPDVGLFQHGPEGWRVVVVN